MGKLVGLSFLNHWTREFPGGPVDENPSTDAWDMGSIPGLGRCHVLQSI